jgi:hypothetical protein
MAGSLLVVHVHVRVKPGAEGAFHAASLANAEASRREPGVVRFDLLADREDPSHFVLVEVLRDVARRGGGPHGRAAPEREVRQCLARRRGVVTRVRFEFATAARIVFGPGSLAEAGEIAAGMGRRALLVTGRTPARA